jgi:hypothetical protein
VSGRERARNIRFYTCTEWFDPTESRWEWAGDGDTTDIRPAELTEADAENAWAAYVADWEAARAEGCTPLRYRLAVYVWSDDADDVLLDWIEIASVDAVQGSAVAS